MCICICDVRTNVLVLCLTYFCWRSRCFCFVLFKDPNSENQIHIRADLHMYASLLYHNNTITHQFASPQRKGYVHVAMTGSGGTLQLNDGIVLSEGDGAFVTEEQQLTFTAVNNTNNNKPVEFVFFDLV